MEPPPSTPLSEAPDNIFINSDGSPLGIFAEAGHIMNRPQLVRRLKRHGAVIRSDPKDSQIILVNPESSSGRILVRNWGKDSNKVVLDSAWVNKCFASERALLGDDGYGGCIVIDDGRSLDDDDDQESDDEIAKSPLPTPRNTPIEPVQPYSKPKDASYPYSASQQTTRVSSDFSNAGPSRTTEVAPVPTAPTFNGMDMAAMAQLMQQFSSAAMPPATQMPMMMNQQQAAMMSMFPAGFPYGPQQNMQTDPFWLAVQDAMMNKGLYPTQTQPPPLFSRPSFSQVPPISPVREQVLPYPPIPSGENFHSSTITKGKQRAVSPPSKRRKTSSISFQEAPPSSSKSNDSSMGPPSGGKKIFTTSSGDPFAFFVQVGGYNRFNLVQSIKKNGGAIVSGVSEADYVILFPPSGSKPDKVAHERFLSMAEKGGQPAVSPKFIHDCLEYGQMIETEQYEFISKNSKRKRPVKSTSPLEPESEDDDEEQTSAESEETRRRQQSEDDEQKRLDKCRRESERRQRMREEKERQRLSRPPSPVPGPSSEGLSQVSKARGRQRNSQSWEDPSDSGPRSPTPPGEHTQILHGNRGHFKFSDEENAYAIKYGKILVERNYQISMHAVGTAIHKKMPHHTLKSWRTHLGSLPSFDFDEWQKRAGIAYRKKMTQASTDHTPIVQSPAIKEIFGIDHARHSDPPPTVMSPSPIAQAPLARPPAHTARAESVRTSLEDDLVIISNFFAECDDDQTETEEAIWAKLTAQAACKTEMTWEDFYQRHSDEVQRRYQKLVDAKTKTGAGN